MKIRNLFVVLMLIVNIAFAQNAPQNANDVLKDALKEAKAQNKKVFINSVHRGVVGVIKWMIA